jgi:hypothetical protein
MEGVYEALLAIYRQTDWSWQKSYTGAWLAPGIVLNQGSFTVQQYSNQVIADATATAALLAYTGMPLLTQLQFRNMAYSIYNIVGYDDGQTVGQGNYPYATLTLDRPWTEPISGPGISYTIYQCYFVSPVQNFNKFVEFQDFVNCQDLDFWSMTQAQLAIQDPQRLDFSIPRFVVPFGVDQRPGSATLGWPMFELWPHQGNPCPYNFGYRQLGPLPQTQQDYITMTTPYPVGEDMVDWRARTLLYLDAEARKGHTVARGAGANWALLSQAAEKQYSYLLGQAIALDLNLDGESLQRIGRRSRYPGGEAYATMNGGLNIGGYRDN